MKETDRKVSLARQLHPELDEWALPRSAAMVTGGLVLAFGLFVGVLMAAERRRVFREESRREFR